MSRNSKFAIMLILILTLMGLGIWYFQGKFAPPKYTGVFENTYEQGRGQKQQRTREKKSQSPTKKYEGTSEGDIQKFRGNRYSTY